MTYIVHCKVPKIAVNRLGKIPRPVFSENYEAEIEKSFNAVGAFLEELDLDAVPLRTAHAFSVELTEEQLEKIKSHPEVLAVETSKTHRV